MPVDFTPKSGEGSKKKKKSRFGSLPGSKFVGQFAKDLGNAAKGAPGAFYVQGKAFGKDIAAGEYKNVGGFPLPTGKNTRKVFKETTKSTVETARHPLRNPGYTFLTALGIAAPAIGGAGRAGLLGKAAKTAAKTPNPIRTIRYKPKTVKEGVELRKMLGESVTVSKDIWAQGKEMGIPSTKKVGKRVQTISAQEMRAAIKQKVEARALEPIEVKVPASRTLQTHGLQAASDKLRSKSPSRQKKKVLKEKAREADVLGRHGSQDAQGVTQAWKDVRTKEPWQALGKKPVKEGVGDVNALVRALRLYRVGYVPPNRLGAEVVAAIHHPKNYVKNIKQERRTRRGDNPTARAIDRAGGETGGQALMDTGHTGPASTLMRGVGTTIGKVTDRAPRARVWHEEARRHGIDEADLPGLLKKVEAGDKLAQDIYTQISRRAEEAAIKFTRSDPLPGAPKSVAGKVDRVLARNIFLYKWITGSGQYAGHMVGNHPTLTAVLAQQGQQSPHISEMLPEYPEFMERYMPVSGDKVSNLQAASLWDMPGEVAKNLEKGITEDPWYLGEHLNPVQHALATALSAKNLFTGRELPDNKKDPLSRIRFGAEQELGGIPYVKLLPEKYGGRINAGDQSERLFDMSNWDVILQHLLGGGYPVKVNKQPAKRMAEQEKAKKSGKPKRKRRKRSGF